MEGAFELDRETRRRLLIVTGTAAGLCLLIVLGTATQNYARYSMRLNEEANFWAVMEWPALWWSGWVLLTPVVFEFAWQKPIVAQHRAVRTLGYVLGAFLVMAIHDLYQVGIMFLPGYNSPHNGFYDALEFHVLSSLYLNFFIYWAIVGAAHAVKAYLRDHEKALGAARLETELATARLDVLRMQLHPHFLFNTLNGISALMYREPKKADDMINRLSRLLRRALDKSNDHEVTLREEMEFLAEYLEIERMRFDEALELSIDVPPELGELLVPTFVFQPLVENSIKHAVVPQGSKGRIGIRARAVDRLRLEVSDDGPGLSNDSDPLTAGVGLSNLVDRLDRLYGTDYRLDLRSSDSGGLAVHLDLPLRTSPLIEPTRPRSE